MSFGNTFENDVLKLILNGTAIANIADNAASSPLTNLWAALHTADPGEGGTQSTNEAAYTSYARVAVARTSGGLPVTGNSGSPAANIQFPQATGGSETLTYFSLGVAASGASKILWRGPLGAILGSFSAFTDDVIHIPGNTLSVNDRIAFFPSYDSSLPAGLVEGILYFVLTASGDFITVSDTQGGSQTNITVAGSGVVWKMTPIPVTSGSTPILGTDTTLKLD